jgi:hypothetical protein
MDVLLLGAAAIVLIALTVWIVWRPTPPETAPGTARSEEGVEMLPQGQRFEDQYTSATADLSAGGVAVTAAQEAEQTAETSEFQRAGEPWSEPGLAREGALLPPGLTPERALPEPSLTARVSQPRTIGLGAAALLTMGSAAAGAWLYARWQRRRNQPLNRLRRRFR